jgi:acyl carrier protein
MGLDSVELVVEFEKYFRIAIPDREAEQIGTVEQAAACVARLRNIPLLQGRSAVYTTILKQLMVALRASYPAVKEDTLVFSLGSPYNHLRLRQELTAALQWQVPPLPPLLRPPTQQNWIQRWLKFPPLWIVDLSGSTVADLTDWIISYNYQKLTAAPATLYEVQRAVIGISSDKLGVEVPEIRLADSFTTDLGVD